MENLNFLRKEKVIPLDVKREDIAKNAAGRLQELIELLNSDKETIDSIIGEGRSSVQLATDIGKIKDKILKYGLAHRSHFEDKMMNPLVEFCGFVKRMRKPIVEGPEKKKEIIIDCFDRMNECAKLCLSDEDNAKKEFSEGDFFAEANRKSA
jgi:hypothetical protein